MFCWRTSMILVQVPSPRQILVQFFLPFGHQHQPFRALYCRDQPSLLDYVQGSTTIHSLEESMLHRQNMLDQLKITLVRTRQSMATTANKTMINHTFFFYDGWVFLRICHYHQQFVAQRTSNKLAKCFFGPFKVLHHVGSVAYHLDLPPESQSHPIFSHFPPLHLPWTKNSPENHLPSTLICTKPQLTNLFSLG